MDYFRRNAKTLVFIIAILVIAGFAMMQVPNLMRSFNQKANYVGKVNGEVISYEDFKSQLNNYAKSYRQQNPEMEITDALWARISDQVWNQYINSILLSEEIDDRKITVTDEEIIDELKNNPLPMFKSSEQFMTDGKFDQSKYLEYLQNGPEEMLVNLENYVRELIPNEKLTEEITSEVKITEEDAKKDYLKENDKLNAEVIFFNYRNQEVEVSDEEISNYYDKNEKEFEEVPLRELDYIKIALEPSPKDDKLALDKANDVLAKLNKENADFAEMAKEFSEGPSAKSGGDLNFFTKNRMVAPFSNKAFSMKVGEISEPVKTRFGYHIIKVTDTKNNDKGEKEVRASHILFNVEASQETKNNLKTTAEQIFAKAEAGDSLVTVAKDFSLANKKSGKFKADARSIRGIGANQELIDFSFNNKVGSLHNLIEDEKGNFFIAKISYAIEDHIKKFEDVKTKISTKLKKEKQIEKAAEAGNKFVAENDDYLAAAKRDSLKIVSLKDYKAEKYISNIGRDEEFTSAMFSKNEGEYTKLFESKKGAYLAKVTKRMKPDMKKFDDQKEKLISELQTKKEDEHYSEWLKNLKDNAKIEDNRDVFFNF